MSFEYPLAFLIPVIFIICKLLCPAKTEALIFPNTEYFQKRKFKVSLLELIIIILISVSLASPVKTQVIKNISKKGYDIVAVLDTSGSMNEYHKIENAKAIIADFAKKRKNDRMGLVIFGNIAYIASPLTYDKKTFEQILRRIYVGIAGGRTAIYDALFLSAGLFKNSKAKNKIIILITDGQDNQSVTPLDVAIKELKKFHIKVYAIGLGPFVNSTVLKKIAKSTGGKYYHLTNPAQLKEVFSQINRLEKSIIKSNAIILNKYFYQYPLILAILLYVIFLYVYRRNIWSF
jgi:Ca-activated chloride channel family protein